MSLQVLIYAHTDKGRRMTDGKLKTTKIEDVLSKATRTLDSHQFEELVTKLEKYLEGKNREKKTDY